MEIRLKTADTIARLATHPLIKEPLFNAGVLATLLSYASSNNVELLQLLLKALAGLAVRDTVHDKRVLGDQYEKFVLQSRRIAGSTTPFQKLHAAIVGTGKGAPLAAFLFRCSHRAGLACLPLDTRVRSGFVRLQFTKCWCAGAWMAPKS